jgi:pimeloyl-ACP methyl ester carboxylesterase
MREHKWLDTEAYPFQSKYCRVDGNNMHYVDEGKGEAILFVHGTPTWSFDYRHLIKGMRQNYRCVAVDHIGFGLSDKPSDYSYTVSTHIHNIEQFIISRDLRNFTLVVHDFGAVIGIGAALRHPERVKRLVILNSWLWNCEAQADFIKLRKVLKSPLLPVLYRYLNFSASVLLPRSFGAKKLSKKLLKQYTGPFARIKEREGPSGFAHSLLKEQELFGAIWNKCQMFQHCPVLLIWGMQDRFLGADYLNQYLQAYPGASVVRLPGCGHFPQEEEHEKVLQACKEFLRST